MTPEELVEACRRGDPDAQRALYDATCDRVYRLLLRMTRNSQDAFDLAQETYLKAFTRIGQFDAAASVTTWLYRIAVNEALQFLRSDKRRLQRIQAQTPPGPDLRPTEAVDARLDVEAGLARLPEFERALLVLRYMEGMDYAEMARVLDRPAGTIASGLNRARRLLREAMGDEPREEPPHTGHLRE